MGSREVESGTRQMATQCLQAGRKEEAQAWHHTAEALATERQAREAAEARAERLAEALRDCLTTLDGLSNDEGLDPDSAILLSETYTRGRTTLQSEEK